MTAEEFLDKVGDSVIVKAGNCSDLEVVYAQASGQFFESSNGTGYIIRDSIFTTSQEQSCLTCVIVNNLSF